MSLGDWSDRFLQRIADNDALRWSLWAVGCLAVVLVYLWWWADTRKRATAQPQQTRPTVRPARDHSPWIERIFVWLVAYPLYILEIGFFCAISWLGFGEGLGLPDLMWGDSIWFGI